MKKFIQVLKQEYERIFEDWYIKMDVNRGKIQKYLEMTIDYTTKGLCKTMMFDYIKEILESFDKIYPKATGTNSSADRTNLSVLSNNCTKPETKKSEQFHKVVAKLLFANKKDKPNTGTAISYLKMGVIEPY